MPILKNIAIGVTLVSILGGVSAVGAEARVTPTTTLTPVVVDLTTSTILRTTSTVRTTSTPPVIVKPLTRAQLAQRRAALRKEHRNKLAALRKQWKKTKPTAKQKIAQEKALQVELNRKLAELIKRR